MRLEADFEMNTNWLIRDYRKIFIALLKNTLTAFDPFLCRYLYGTKAEKKMVNKPFTFFVRFLDYDGVDEKRILCGNRISFLFSSDDEKLFVAFYNGLLQRKKLVIGKNHPIVFTLNNVCLLPDKKITTDKVLFKTIAPVLVNETKSGFYLSPEQPEFADAFKKIIAAQASNFHIYCNENMIRFDFSSMKKICLSHYNQTMTSWLGEFALEAPANTLQMVYDQGIGVRRSQGFGMLQLLKQY